MKKFENDRRADYIYVLVTHRYNPNREIYWPKSKRLSKFMDNNGVPDWIYQQLIDRFMESGR